MENLVTRYRNSSVLVAVLFAQVLGLAIQVKRPTEAGSARLLRLWVVNTVTPIERGLVSSGRAVRGVWGDYAYLRGVRKENRQLREQVERMRIEQVRLHEEANQAHRLQGLLNFKEQFISATIPAQVIGTSGSDQSRVVYLDKGAEDGIRPDMAVITPDGIVGKVLHVFGSSSQVLEINDASSGVGAILEKSRLQGILQGTAVGAIVVRYVMTEEKIEPGERVLTSGGDRIFPKGLPIGTVIQATPGSDLFLNIQVKPAADLARLEEVLVVTKIADTEPVKQLAGAPKRAADVLAERLPSVPPKAAAKLSETKAGTGLTEKPSDASAARKPSTPSATPQKPPATKAPSMPEAASETVKAATPAASMTLKPTAVSPALAGANPIPKPATTTRPAKENGSASPGAAVTNDSTPKPATLVAPGQVAGMRAASPTPAGQRGAKRNIKVIDDQDSANATSVTTKTKTAGGGATKASTTASDNPADGLSVGAKTATTKPPAKTAKPAGEKRKPLENGSGRTGEIQAAPGEPSAATPAGAVSH